MQKQTAHLLAAIPETLYFTWEELFLKKGVRQYDNSGFFSRRIIGLPEVLYDKTGWYG